ncbi:hypothetical protein A8709_14680 [Paenibacillus pectinilyticus]|uniref:DNA-binding response regulator n=1 Tax=Paenibacillus pectinilyticus TaxID=512399 RepID=A0A1C1A450_9BACL|nr:response regulator [Paenibacillus pectinilyticus]OCT15334.1 hypothetical protein A8709_14680 [Paenibacillus pectinilyticus]
MTYTIMLVEDEPPILYAIKHLIETETDDFTVIAAVPNGRDALEALEGQVPDIIITDIQMPFVNGLDLIAAVQISHPQIKCVILTGHSDFAYAQKALRTNAFDYLLKPIQIDQLRNLLASLKETLQAIRFQRELAALHNAIFFEQYADEGSIHFSKRYLAPVVICAGHFAHETWYADHPGRQFWEQTDHLAAIQTSFKPIWLLNGFSSNERIVVIGLDAPEHSVIEGVASTLSQQLSEAGIPIQIIYGEPVTELSELAHGIKKLRSALAKKIVFGESGVFREINEPAPSSLIPSIDENRFVYLAQHPNREAFKKDFLSLLKEWQAKKYVQAKIDALLQEVGHKLVHVHQAELGKMSISNTLISEAIGNSMSYSELAEAYCRIISVIYEQTSHKLMHTSAAEIVAHMEAYFENNFTSAISYKMFHELFGFNETYLSHVFKQQRGITPNKYVTRLRIEKAKELISLQPDTPLKTIAALVGYEDAFYFSRVFKEMTGSSPSEFNKHGKDQITR